MPNEQGPDPVEIQAAEGRVRETLAAGAVRPSEELPEDLRHLPERRAAQEIEAARQEGETKRERLKQEIDAKRERDKQEIELRRTYARGLLIILTGQLVVADVVFWLFAELGKHWVLSTAVINTWLAAVVVQVIGVVTVVTLHLFPRRDTAPDTGGGA
jgi:hypothetical protein